MMLQLKDWWSGLLSSGCHLGYHGNTAKTWQVVKEEYLASACIFNSSGIQTTSAGWPYLGVAIGSQDYIRNYTQAKDHIPQWAQGLSQLSLIAATQMQPHAWPWVLYELIHAMMISCPPPPSLLFDSFCLP